MGKDQFKKGGLGGISEAVGQPGSLAQFQDFSC
jgi:hypothetical protein